MYTAHSPGVVRRTADGALVLAAGDLPATRDYLTWLNAGNQPAPAPPPAPAVPQSVVTRRQAMLALLAAGKLDAVEAVISQAPRAVQITWSAAQDFERTNPLIESLAPPLGLTEADVDNLFIEAAKL